MGFRDNLMARGAAVAQPKEPDPTELQGREPKTMPGKSAAFQSERRELEAQIESLKQKVAEAGKPIELPLAELHEKPGRRRQLSIEDYNALKDNLRNNPLAHPIAVRKRKQGGYEIVSGHNRAAIYRELGRETIKAVVTEHGDHEVDRIAFYANLLSPELTAWEQYEFLSRWQSEHNLTQEQMAKESGIPQQRISNYLAPGRLPQGARAMIQSAPHKIGSKVIVALTKVADSITTQRMIESVGFAIEQGASEKEVLAFALHRPAAKAKADFAPITIRRGKKTYCKLDRRDNKLVLNFAVPEDAIQATQDIQAFLGLLAEKG